MISSGMAHQSTICRSGNKNLVPSKSTIMKDESKVIAIELKNSNQILEESILEESVDNIEEEVQQQEIIRDLKSINFWIIIGLGIIRTSTSRFYLSNFKIIGLTYFHNDKLINFIGSISYLFYIIQGFTYTYTFKFLGLRNSYYFIFIFVCGSVFCHFCVTWFFLSPGIDPLSFRGHSSQRQAGSRVSSAARHH